jgi:ankyrin repeat protein
MSAAAVVCAAANAAETKALAATIYVKALAAAQRNDTKALTEIWEKHGSRIFTEPLPEESGFILHYAAKGLRVKSVIWLLEHGADVNAIDREGEVRMH